MLEFFFYLPMVQVPINIINSFVFSNIGSVNIFFLISMCCAASLRYLDLYNRRVHGLWGSSPRVQNLTYAAMGKIKKNIY
jgi:hypothetical protein